MEAVERTGYTRLYATVSGTVLVLLGLAGLIENAQFEDPELWSELLGFYAVNGWTSLLQIGLGLAALLSAQKLSRLWAVAATFIFLGLGLWGVFAPDGTLLFGVLPAPRTVNLSYLLFGAFALAALAASSWDRISAAVSERGDRIRQRRQQRRRRLERESRRKRLAPEAGRSRSGGKGGGSESGS